MKTASGMVVTMHYTLTDDAGTVLDSSEGREPLAYLHGHGNIIPGLEKALEGSEPGFKSSVTVPPGEGYGEKNPEAVFEAPREHFPPEMELAPGNQVYAEGPRGPVTFTIVDTSDSGVVLDANHPLAGQTLHFDVEVVEVREATQEELEHGHVHGEGGHEH
jgi:FKBP-type peptidyl-prolyl cis-trans isomerase SlyD